MANPLLPADSQC
jgi:hypothetical protein